MAKKAIKREPRSIDPFNACQTLNKLFGAVDNMTFDLFRYRHTHYVNLIETIARFSLIARNPKASQEVHKELNSLLDKYQREYGWMHENF